MKFFAVICTRNPKLSSQTRGLVSKLSSFGVDVKLLVNQDSIFSAYHKGLTKCEASDTDIVIFCHDDIQILSNKENFIAALSICVKPKTGIVGPAGTTFLGENAVWWDHDNWKKGLHRGAVNHIAQEEPPTIDTTTYGPYGEVVALDGLFLAARKKVWEHIKVEKPTYFEGLWDFYDIHYTTTAHALGYNNYAVPIKMIHHSSGQLVGRDSWHKNRTAFIKHTTLPMKVK